MSETFNIYCDESCHLEKDEHAVMVLGAVWCPLDKSRDIAVRIRELKAKHGFHPKFEIKWQKVSPKKLAFYLDVLDFFFDDDDLHFRALIIPDKQALRHDIHGHTHDDFYYKMYFSMLKVLLRPTEKYRIFIDIKDTRGAERIAKLWSVLCSAVYDFRHEIITNVQLVRSHEVEQQQLADLLIGCISYCNRGHFASSAKKALVDRMRKRSGYKLTQTTLVMEQKVNLFKWRAQEVQG
jgi:hypothetical protein